MRGKPSDCWKTLPELRITPADAGKTPSETARKSGLEDHPRGCGENVFIPVLLKLPHGSPPRMRGKLTIICSDVNSSGITPADAGKTLKEQVSWTMLQDHPRGCGENAFPFLPFSL